MGASNEPKAVKARARADDLAYMRDVSNDWFRLLKGEVTTEGYGLYGYSQKRKGEGWFTTLRVSNPKGVVVFGVVFGMGASPRRSILDAVEKLRQGKVKPDDYA